MSRWLTNPGRLRLQAVDVLVMAYATLLMLIGIVFNPRVPNWPAFVGLEAVALVAYLAAVWTSGGLPAGWPRAILRLIALLWVNGHYFNSANYIQHVFVPQWLDPELIRWETTTFGVNPNLWMDRVTSVPMNEWMAFAYVVYVPLLPLLGFIAYWKGKERGLHEYMFTLAMAYMLCDFGFSIYPVAGPMIGMPGQWLASIDGVFFTHASEFMRHNLHYPGGCLPSPHCAAGSVVLVAAWRRWRPLGWVLIPITLSIYLSTVYLRFHYLTDVWTGILVAVVVFAVAPGMERLFRRWGVIGEV
jgi:membrane-associated phospholipid phosphatase